MCSNDNILNVISLTGNLLINNWIYYYIYSKSLSFSKGKKQKLFQLFLF